MMHTLGKIEQLTTEVTYGPSVLSLSRPLPLRVFSFKVGEMFAVVVSSGLAAGRTLLARELVSMGRDPDDAVTAEVEEIPLGREMAVVL